GSSSRAAEGPPAAGAGFPHPVSRARESPFVNGAHPGEGAMDRNAKFETRAQTPLYERLLALPGQAILTAVALPVLAPILVARGGKRMAGGGRVRRVARATLLAAAEAEIARGRMPGGLVHV